MPDYIYLIHPLRQEFFESPTPEEEAAMEAHYQYLKKSAVQGVVILAGLCLDETFGVVVFTADSDEAARAFMFNDPCIQSNVMIAELHPMRVSLMTPSLRKD
jgi:uncharacterized protein YciI